MRSFLVLLLVFSASAAFGEIYTWKDSHGTSYYANNINDIPARYLKKARVLDVATGKKGGLATAQPVSTTSPGQVAAQPAPPANPAPPAAAPVAAPPVVAAPVALPPEVARPQQTQPTETRAQRRAHRRQGGGGEE